MVVGFFNVKLKEVDIEDILIQSQKYNKEIENLMKIEVLLNKINVQIF